MFSIQRELSIAREALREKQRREAALLKERDDKLDGRDVNKYVQEAQKVANRISAKMAVGGGGGNYSLGESEYIASGYSYILYSNAMYNSGGKEGIGCDIEQNERSKSK